MAKHQTWGPQPRPPGDLRGGDLIVASTQKLSEEKRPRTGTLCPAVIKVRCFLGDTGEHVACSYGRKHIYTCLQSALRRIHYSPSVQLPRVCLHTHSHNMMHPTRLVRNAQRPPISPVPPPRPGGGNRVLVAATTLAAAGAGYYFYTQPDREVRSLNILPCQVRTWIPVGSLGTEPAKRPWEG